MSSLIWCATALLAISQGDECGCHLYRLSNPVVGLGHSLSSVPRYEIV